MLQQEWSAFCGYVKKKRWWLILFTFLFFAVWLPWIGGSTPRIDGERMIVDPYSTSNWLGIGRQGGILSQWLLGIRWFNPVFINTVGYLMMACVGVVLGYLFYRTRQRGAVACAAFGFVAFTAPIMAEQFYFDMQLMMIALAYLLCAASVATGYVAILRKKPAFAVLAVLCLIWCASTYQIFAVMYGTLSVALFILLYQRWSLEEKRENPPYLRLIVGLIAVLVVAMGLNSVITLFFSSDASYLTQQIFWGKQPAAQCVRGILQHMKAGFLGGDPFYTPFMGVTALLVLASAVWQSFRSPRPKGYFLYLLALAGLQLCPFLMSVAFGTTPVIRSQLIYPLVLACNVMLLFLLWQEKLPRILLVAMSVVLCWNQVSTTQRLIYTEAVRVQEDERIICQIDERIQSIDGKGKPIAFVGARKGVLNPACIQGEVIGFSGLNWGQYEPPYHYVSTKRICRLANVFGLNFSHIEEDQLLEARRFALDMPVWPSFGSVADAGDYIVVKLSEDWAADELMEPSITPVVLEDAYQPLNPEIGRFSLETWSVTDGTLILGGWHGIPDLLPDTVSLTVYLQEQDSEDFFALSTVKKQRADVAIYFSDSRLTNSGFVAKCPVAELSQHLDHYTAYLGLERNGTLFLLPLGALTH